MKPEFDSFEIRQTLSLLTPCRAVGVGKVRIGGDTDGGYVMLDNFSSDMIAYSIGVGGDVSWDVDIAKRGIDVFQFDHTVPGSPVVNEKFHFQKIGIAPPGDWGPEFKSLDQILKDNEHCDRKMILKMDIEDAEWTVIDALPSAILAKFSQIVIEFHGLARLANSEWRHMARRVLSKLRHSHASVHVHANNWGSYSIVEGIPCPDVLEITFAARSLFQFGKNQEIFPTALDHPCKAGKEDYFLARFEFDDATL